MITKIYETKEEWLEDRKGRIGGSSLGDIVVKRGTGEKIGFYKIIAERIARPSDGENPMDRGTRLEDEAIEKFKEKTGKEVDTSLVMWTRDDNTAITVSPDGFIGETEAVEVKCLSSEKHIKAYIEKKIPDEYPNDYTMQVLQYFIVNETLEKLYFVMYDPNMPENLQLHWIEVTRESVQEDVDFYLNYQREKLERIEEIINELTF